MGLAFSTISFLLDAHQRRVNFKDTLTLGRTQLYLNPVETQKVCNLAGRTLSGPALQTKFGGFADEFLKDLLGIETLSALDYSPYEGASIIHDMNQPIPRELEGRFDAVIDAGTIEHIFNFPVAIANCMRMVRPGGRLFIITAANNHCGHGFYQFSPELFFRLFQNRNGFCIERLLLLKHPFPGMELSSAQQIYSVKDPEELGERVGLVTDSPVILLVEAERRSLGDILTTFPQQSDYVALWQSQPRAINRARHPRFVERLQKIFHTISQSALPWPIKKVIFRIAGLYQRHFIYSFRNKRLYRRTGPFSSK